MPEQIIESDRGRCLTCGFVGIIASPHPDGIREAYLKDRIRGELWGLPERPTQPWCLKERRDFTVEMQKIAGEEFYSRNLPTKQMLAKDRKCADWFSYEQFSSPTQHRERALIIELEELRRANDLQIAELHLQATENTRIILENQTIITENIASATKATNETMSALAEIQEKSGETLSKGNDVAERNLDVVKNLQAVTATQAEETKGFNKTSLVVALVALGVAGVGLISSLLLPAGIGGGGNVVIVTPTATLTATFVPTMAPTPITPVSPTR